MQLKKHFFAHLAWLTGWKRRVSALLQVTLPLAALSERPLGVSLVGPRGADEALIDLAVALTTALKVVPDDP